MALGTYVEYDGKPAVRFIRDYPQDLPDVWQAITEPDRLRHWFLSEVNL